MKSMIFDQSSIMSDPNNNDNSGSPVSNLGASSNKKSSEKYSLRQRQKRETTSRSGGGGSSSGAGCSTGSSSSIALKELCCDHEPAAKEKPKSKAAPLSKYRRKTANARERTRMREINSAFENLRSCVPHSMGGGGHQSPTNEKLTKITTLRLAMKYIQTLSDALTNPSHDTSFLYGGNNNDRSFSNNNICQTSDNNFNAMDILYSSGTESSTPSPIKVRTTIVKAQNRARQKAKQKFAEAFIPSSSSGSGVNMTSPKIDDNPTDLGLLLESDGESLHLSEPCLSPLGHHMKPFGCNPADSALELGLLLESDSESLQFSEPCLSPLGALDSFNPFGDLLHTEFSEQTSLDMYLT